MKRLVNILRSLHPEVDIIREERLIDSGILDSFDIVTIVAEVDEAYGVIIPPEALTPENFNSVRNLYSLVLGLL